jgi:subtilisin
VIGVADRAVGGEPQAPEWVRGELGGATGRGIRVAVIDSGWDRSIEDPRVLPGVSFVHPADDFAMAQGDDDQDVLGHGTACADLILRIAPDARIVPVRVFGRVLETSPGTLQTALRWAIEAGVQVINVSLGTRLKGTLYPLYTACEIARQAGIMVVAAGDNARQWSYPAIFENVIGVDAARFDSPWHFRYRPDDAMECVAWGVDHPVLWVGGERIPKQGTSFAAPNVAGIVALILERHPGATLEQVRDLLACFAVEVVHGTSDDEHDVPPPPDKRTSRSRTTKPRPGTQPSPAAAEPAPAPVPKPGKRISPRASKAAKPPRSVADAAPPAKPRAKPLKAADAAAKPRPPRPKPSAPGA